jgi:hypothetical protein
MQEGGWQMSHENYISHTPHLLKSLNFAGAHLFGVAFIVKEDVALCPMDLSLFGGIRIMFDTDSIA